MTLRKGRFTEKFAAPSRLVVTSYKHGRTCGALAYSAVIVGI